MDSIDLKAKLWSLKDKFNDVSLICGQGESKKTVKAHKIILAGLVSLSLVFFVFLISGSVQRSIRENKCLLCGCVVSILKFQFLQRFLCKVFVMRSLAFGSAMFTL
jgi:hypothetical protein